MDDLKKAGNEAVSRGEYLDAVHKYLEALGVAKTEDTGPVFSNLSFAYYKLKQFNQALEAASNCVAVKPGWQKGYFRKGESQFGLRLYKEAEESYVKALELSQGDATIEKRLFLTREALKGFFFRQLSPGRHFAVGQGSNVIQAQIFSSAQQMKNYIYLVGDARTREVVVVDPAWDVQSILAFAEAELVTVVGAIVTHFHFDHVGGIPPPPFDALGITVPGVREFAAEGGRKVHIHSKDTNQVLAKTKLPETSVVKVEHKSNLILGSVEIQFLHTPGHSPGSQCVYIPRVPGSSEGLLLSGDTLFIKSCGRLDLPESNKKEMYNSLQNILAVLPDSTKVYPGHNYGGNSTTIADEKTKGMLASMTEQDWLSMHS